MVLKYFKICQGKLLSVKTAQNMHFSLGLTYALSVKLGLKGYSTFFGNRLILQLP